MIKISYKLLVKNLLAYQLRSKSNQTSLIAIKVIQASLVNSEKYVATN